MPISNDQQQTAQKAMSEMLTSALGLTLFAADDKEGTVSRIEEMCAAFPSGHHVQGEERTRMLLQMVNDTRRASRTLAGVLREVLDSYGEEGDASEMADAHDDAEHLESD